MRPGESIDAHEAGSPPRPQIAVLPDRVVDQIAAGEVVERPASVVKELVENSLDAGATHVTVEVEGGGKRLIRVLDNGHGMTAEELRLALQRHATSKLRAVADLFDLSTLGFRGEALPSIAAVSRATITTRTRDQVAGTRLVIVGGEVVDCSEVGAPVGTHIEVRDLLFNVPARLKFLKGDATEASHVTDAVSKLSMANPSVHVRLKHGPRTAINAPMHLDQIDRVRTLLGSRLGRRVHEVRGEENGIAVAAYLAAPELCQTTTRGLQLFVGRRPVKDRGIVHAVRMGYGELVPRGRYPVAVVFVDVPGEAVDVNVHPQKLEVRFSDAQRVYAAVRHIVRRGVANAPWLDDVPAIGSSPVRMHAIAASAPPRSRPSRASEMAAGYAQQTTRSLFSRPMSAPKASRMQEVSFPLAPSASAVPPASGAPSAPASRGPLPSPSSAPVPEAAPAAEFFGQLRYVGQVDKTYLVCERAGELVLIDQHAAHERVEFQRLREKHAERALPVQRMLFPQTIELDEQTAAAATESRDTLAELGFEIEPFGGASWAIKSVPAGLRNNDSAAVLRQLLDELSASGGSRAVEERLDLVLATIACHSVVRAGDTLSPREAEALLASMDTVDFKAHCPHGRPVLLRISVAEIARRFGR